MHKQTELLKGVLEGCILELLSKEASYGYAITSRLQKLGFATVVEGTVYTILLRLEKNGLVDVHKEASAKGPNRKLYMLTERGEQRRRDFWTNWNWLSTTLEKIKEMQ